MSYKQPHKLHMLYNYLIIGGGVAGVTAAEAIRGIDTQATIGVVSDEPYPLYSRVLLPNYLKNILPKMIL